MDIGAPSAHVPFLNMRMIKNTNQNLIKKQFENVGCIAAENGNVQLTLFTICNMFAICSIPSQLTTSSRNFCLHRRLFVRLLTGLRPTRKPLSRVLQNSGRRWHKGHGRTTIRSWWQYRSCCVRVGDAVRWSHRHTPRGRICALPNICIIITILRHQRPWRRGELNRVPF